MGVPTLGRLERVQDLHAAWENEPASFTPWLAANIDVLGDAIGLELEVEAQEQAVGPFRADLLCKDPASQWVLIENQLEETDHKHLGQLLTYAAGLQAVTIVWVAANFSEKHRAALDWLNEITNDRFRFFGVEIQLWQIGGSAIAPRFDVVSRPNDWSKAVGGAAEQIENAALTENRRAQLDFWTEFRDFLIERKSPIQPRKPYPQHWMNFGIGRAGFALGASLNHPQQRIGVELYIDHAEAKAFFRELEQQKPAIEATFGAPLVWMELPDRQACRIVYYQAGCDPFDKRRWPEYQAWLKQNLERLRTAFRERVRALGTGVGPEAAAGQ